MNHLSQVRHARRNRSNRYSREVANKLAALCGRRRRGPADRARGPPPQPLVDARAVERVLALGEQPQLVAVRVVRLAHRAAGRRVARRGCCSRGLLLVVAILRIFAAAVVVRWRRRGEHQRGVREQDGLVEPAPAQRVAPLRRPPARAEEGGGRDRHQHRHGSHDQQHVFGHDARLGSIAADSLSLSLQHVAGPSLRFSTCPRAGIRAGTT
jgi:hypothetical protein